MGHQVALKFMALVLLTLGAAPSYAETRLDPRIDVRDCGSPDLSLEEQTDCANCVYRFERDEVVGGQYFGTPDSLDEYCAVTAVCRSRPRQLPGRCPRSVE